MRITSGPNEPFVGLLCLAGPPRAWESAVCSLRPGAQGTDLGTSCSAVPRDGRGATCALSDKWMACGVRGRSHVGHECLADRGLERETGGGRV